MAALPNAPNDNGESSFTCARRRLSFGVRLLRARLRSNRRTCPFCASEDTALIARKYRLLELSRCPRCALAFRWPTDTSERNQRFYEDLYRQHGLTTDLPSPAELASLLDSGFAGSEKDFTAKINLIRSLRPGGRVIDFGSSWGYGVFQFRKFGYDALGFEISGQRSLYGRNHLGVSILSSYDDLDRLDSGSFDIIFSSHVLEHLPALSGVFELFARLLKRDGLLALFMPNCGGRNARKEGIRWGPSVSEKHTIAFDAGFFLMNMPAFGFDTLVLSDPYPATLTSAAFPLNGSRAMDCEGDELGVLCLKRG